MKATHMSIQRWINKQNVSYRHNRIYSNLKKERNSDICYKMMNLEDIMLSEINKSERDKSYMILLT